MSFNFDMAKTYNAPIKQEYAVTKPDISDTPKKEREEKDDSAIGEIVSSLINKAAED